MGKIIRNGIEFCGTSDTADNIIYDNTDSGLAATNTQTAIDELTNKVKAGGNVVYLTQEQYDALPESKESDDVEYRITDAGSMGAAENVGYDNSKSGIEAVNVQDAIDKLDENLNKFVPISNAVYIDATEKTVAVQDFTQYKNIYFTLKAEGAGIFSAIFTTDLLLKSTSVNPLKMFCASPAGDIRIISIYMETNTSLKAKLNAGGWYLTVYGVN